MNRTLSNFRVNPKIAFFIWGPDIKGCYQVKGAAAIRTSDREFEEMRARIHEKHPSLRARSPVIVKIPEVFEGKPGPAARVKIH